MASTSPGEGQIVGTHTKVPDNQSTNAWAIQQNQSSDGKGWVSVQECQKPFQCGLCSVAFEINVELVSHIHNHSLTKPYQCGYCKVSYDNNPELTVHVKSHTRFMIHIPFTTITSAVNQSVTSQPQPSNLPGLFSTAEKSLETSCEAKTNGGLSVLTRLDSGENRATAGSDDDSIKVSNLIEDESDGDDTDMTEYLTETTSAVDRVGSEMVVETPWACEKKIKSENDEIVDKDKVRSNCCLEVKTEGDSEGQGGGNQAERMRGKKCLRKSGRKDEKKKGSSDKPFHCDICGASFKVSRYVNDHKRRVHKMSPSQSCQKPLQDGNDTEAGLYRKKSLRSEGRELPKTLSNATHFTSDFSGVDASSTSVVDKAAPYSSKADDKNSFECSECGKILRNRQTLKRHKIYVHSDNRPFPCTQCSLRFKAKKHLKDHISFVHNDERRFPCSHCSARLKTKVQLSNHIRNKHTNERPYQCVHCSARFKQKGILSTHILNKHTGSDNDSKHDGERSYQCVHCCAQFKQKGTLSTHILMKHNDIDNAVDDRPCACPHCPLKFKKNFRLANHIARVHDNQRPFPCSHCATCFKSKGELSNHVSRRHSTDSPHQCTDCGKCFKVKAALNQHWCRPKECPICKLLLNCQSSYKNHWLRKHSLEKFPCNLCDKAFGTRQELKVHTRTHTNEKPYTCEFCGQSFAMLTYLTYHRNGRHLNNRPYKCNICQKGFNSHPSLFQHKRRHLGDKRYPCTQCDKKFYNSASLQRHALTHTELRSYVCSMCGKTYRSPSSLKYHLKHSHQL